MGEFRMPSLGADMDAGTITEWCVEPGDTVHRGDIIAVVDTDKADIDVEVFEDGTVEELLVPVGERVPVGTPLARLGPPGTDVGAPASAPSRPTSEPGETPPRSVAPAVASPLLRRRAEELGVDPATVRGTGPGGRITKADVEVAAASAPHAPRVARISPRARRLAVEHGVDTTTLFTTTPERVITGEDVEAAAVRTGSSSGEPRDEPVEAEEAPATAREGDRAAAMRSSIARLMARSKREIPHYYLVQDVDFSAAQAWLAERNEGRPVVQRLLPAVLLYKATALAVHDVPELNGFWSDDGFAPSEAVHLGVAVALRGGGLVAPAIHDADALDLDDLMSALRDLVNRARVGKMRASEMSDPTITVTNLGDQGVQAVHGVIYPPQVALVGFGAISERAWAADGMVGARPVVTTTLAADHRASDGSGGARLLRSIDRRLQHPEAL
jgi:pyruvate dehydrogenase E2 component (dihydrolipoamide acetyltransferase)